jgi:hypothetical protein
VTDEACSLCGNDRSRYGCTEREEGSYCRAPPPPPPSTTPSPLAVFDVPDGVKKLARRCPRCGVRVVPVLTDDFERVTVDAATGTVHPRRCGER